MNNTLPVSALLHHAIPRKVAPTQPEHTGVTLFVRLGEDGYVTQAAIRDNRSLLDTKLAALAARRAHK